ncbi:histidine--tRNA ligase [Candidatus Peregrinibacteria bacterium]|nr:histidine--tRNA ligase [Candidatus Peregrinibacteria bacterium]
MQGKYTIFSDNIYYKYTVMEKIEPKILKGTRDFLPEDMAKRLLIMGKIRRIFERFGYDAIETPVICPAETILGKYGGEGEKLTYNFRDAGDRWIALPFDLTVPFARLVAANWRDLPMPFKRYQIQRVWRAEKPQKGRLREFYQCDIDIIGTKSLIAEAEIAKIMVEVFKELGFINFIIKVNSRRLLNEILDSYKIPKEQSLEVIRTIDKLDKVGEQAVIEMLEEIGIKKAKDLMKLLKPEKDNKSTFRKVSKFNIKEIDTFFKYCEKFDIPEKYLQFDPSLARGLDYYTGISYEVVSNDFNFGTLCAGGRYDNLCGLFCNEDFSGVGVAFGFERIVLALQEMNELENVGLNSQVLVTLFDKKSINDSLSIYSELIEAGINSEVYFESDKLAKQFKYANKKQIPYVIVCGPDEAKNDEVTIKEMKTGKQETIHRDQMVSHLK